MARRRRPGAGVAAGAAAPTALPGLGRMTRTGRGTERSKASAASGPCGALGRGVFTSVPGEQGEGEGEPGVMAGMEAGQDVERPCLPARPLRAGRSCNPGPSLPAVPDGCPETRCRAAAEGGPPDGSRLGFGAAQGSALAVLRPDSACRLLGGGSAAPAISTSTKTRPAPTRPQRTPAPRCRRGCGDTAPLPRRPKGFTGAGGSRPGTGGLSSPAPPSRQRSPWGTRRRPGRGRGRWFSGPLPRRQVTRGGAV